MLYDFDPNGTPEEKFKKVLEIATQELSDVRYQLDLFETEVNKWTQEGIMKCESHTQMDMVELMAKATQTCARLGSFFQLASHYHAQVAHKDFTPWELALARGLLEGGFYQYIQQRKQADAAKGMAEKEASADSTIDLLRKIFKGLGPKDT